MNINQAGIDLIKHYEGCRLTAYRCPAGILTIGFGHTGPDVRSGQVITEEQAEALLRQDLGKFEEGVSHSLGDAITTESQFSAMVCLAFNIGLGAFKSSSVLRYHRDNKPNSAAQSFLMWNKGGGIVLAGLTRRRNAERELYLNLTIKP